MTSRTITETAVRTRFTVVLIPDPVDGGYVVMVPRLPGCVTEGETVDEALANAKEVIELWVRQVEADGEELPAEDPQPLVRVVEAEV
jgi:predicted RNase H-like HicB family nuclease